jgi:hypothetical protein
MKTSAASPNEEGTEEEVLAVAKPGPRTLSIVSFKSSTLKVPHFAKVLRAAQADEVFDKVCKDEFGTRGDLFGERRSGLTKLAEFNELVSTHKAKLEKIAQNIENGEGEGEESEEEDEPEVVVESGSRFFLSKEQRKQQEEKEKAKKKRNKLKSKTVAGKLLGSAKGKGRKSGKGGMKDDATADAPPPRSSAASVVSRAMTAGHGQTKAAVSVSSYTIGDTGVVTSSGRQETMASGASVVSGVGRAQGSVCSGAAETNFVAILNGLADKNLLNGAVMRMGRMRQGPKAQADVRDIAVAHTHTLSLCCYCCWCCCCYCRCCCRIT